MAHFLRGEEASFGPNIAAESRLLQLIANRNYKDLKHYFQTEDLSNKTQLKGLYTLFHNKKIAQEDFLTSLIFYSLITESPDRGATIDIIPISLETSENKDLITALAASPDAGKKPAFSGLDNAERQANFIQSLEKISAFSRVYFACTPEILYCKGAPYGQLINALVKLGSYPRLACGKLVILPPAINTCAGQACFGRHFYPLEAQVGRKDLDNILDAVSWGRTAWDAPHPKTPKQTSYHGSERVSTALGYLHELYHQQMRSALPSEFHVITLRIVQLLSFDNPFSWNGENWHLLDGDDNGVFFRTYGAEFVQAYEQASVERRKQLISALFGILYLRNQRNIFFYANKTGEIGSEPYNSFDSLYRFALDLVENRAWYEQFLNWDCLMAEVYSGKLTQNPSLAEITLVAAQLRDHDFFKAYNLAEKLLCLRLNSMALCLHNQTADVTALTPKPLKKDLVVALRKINPKDRRKIDAPQNLVVVTIKTPEQAEEILAFNLTMRDDTIQNLLERSFALTLALFSKPREEWRIWRNLILRAETFLTTETQSLEEGCFLFLEYSSLLLFFAENFLGYFQNPNTHPKLKQFFSQYPDEEAKILKLLEPFFNALYTYSKSERAAGLSYSLTELLQNESLQKRFGHR